ncbi:MAG: hypothetical protein HY247_06225 [archaeon]|nr:MAG: hypothetical protein HY247_06225 [archaeon]
MKCSLCSREAESDLCQYHEEAKSRLKAAYKEWVEAYGKMGWKDYLDNVKRSAQTGQWVKEVAERLESVD